MATELQRTTWSEPQLRTRLEPELRRRMGPATLGDIVTSTGLPAEQTEPVLRRLLDDYHGRLAVDENGELIYSFPHGLKRPVSWRDRLRQAGAALWRGFKTAYKVGILVVLVAYFVVFLVVMVAALVAFGGEGCGGCLFPFDWLWFVDVPATGRTRAAWSSNASAPRGKRRERKVSPWLQAYEFGFGPGAPPGAPLAEERMLLHYVREHNGCLSALDVAGLTGQSLEEAERTLLHLMVAHGGDVEVSDDGTLLYTFDRLMVTAGRPATDEGRGWSWWWERPEQPSTLNRNSTASNWVLGLLNGFNLIWSGIFTFSPGVIGPGLPGWVASVLGPVPFIFSGLFFAIPLVRSSLLRAENARRQERNGLREIARRLFHGHVVRPDIDLVSAAELMQEQGAAGEHLGLAAIQRHLDWLIKAWEGEPDSDAEGKLGWRFPRLQQEAADVRAAREGRDPAQFRLGAVEYDSEASP
ncbi:MAG: hypothetical protein HYU66_18210 [Armatimonadetes bacterium]|nr:hypothetical protein [Armatimonadota bacterium]